MRRSLAGEEAGGQDKKTTEEDAGADLAEEHAGYLVLWTGLLISSSLSFSLLCAPNSPP
jgi:hypothetical protein